MAFWMSTTTCSTTNHQTPSAEAVVEVEVLLLQMVAEAAEVAGEEVVVQAYLSA